MLASWCFRRGCEALDVLILILTAISMMKTYYFSKNKDSGMM